MLREGDPLRALAHRLDRPEADRREQVADARGEQHRDRPADQERPVSVARVSSRSPSEAPVTTTSGSTLRRAPGARGSARARRRPRRCARARGDRARHSAPRRDAVPARGPRSCRPAIARWTSRIWMKPSSDSTSRGPPTTDRAASRSTARARRRRPSATAATCRRSRPGCSSWRSYTNTPIAAISSVIARAKAAVIRTRIGSRLRPTTLRPFAAGSRRPVPSRATSRRTAGRSSRAGSGRRPRRRSSGSHSRSPMRAPAAGTG